MTGLPGGAVTFLFSDIEGSTRLVKALRDRYPQVLAEHRELVRAAITDHAGYEVDTQGDAFFVAFAAAKQAVLCALQVQRALAAHQWPAGAAVRVRMGIHTGHAVPAEGAYTGLAVHRAARICAAACGGQVLVSQATQTIIEDDEEEGLGFSLEDLGEHRLKDLDRPVRLFQLAAPGLGAWAGPVAGRQAAGLPRNGMAAAPARDVDPGPGSGYVSGGITAESARAEFGAAGLPPGIRALPRDVASFTGRQAELRQLAGSVASAGGVVGIHAIGGMAGIGKTALAVHAAHQLAPRFPDGQIFLPLYGHTPGHRPADPADALASLLLIIGLSAQQIPPGLEARMGLWRDRAAGRRFLLVLDDAADSEQVRPLLPGTECLVLITSRRHLSALEDARPVSLDILPPEDAAALFTRLAARPGLDPADEVVSRITRLCGFLPLAVGLMARQLHHHPAWTPDELAESLAAARDRLQLLQAEDLSVAAAFDLSYAELTADRRRLFRRLGLHPGPDLDPYAAAALDGTDPAAARAGLAALYDRYLLTEPGRGRYRFHDLIREHARALAARDEPPGDQDRAVGRLLGYYQAAAGAADRRLTRYTRPSGHPPGAAAAPGVSPDPASMAAGPELPDSTRALSWARAERANLLACLDQAADAGQHAQVVGLTAAMAALLRYDGPWADAITRHAAAVHAAQRLGDRLAEAGVLLDLGVVRHETGQYPDAARALEAALGLYRDLGDRLGQANALHELGVVWERTGKYPDAAQALEAALAIYREVGDRLGQANALEWLGYMRSQMGEYPPAIAALQEALGIFDDLGDRLGQAGALRRLSRVLLWTGEYRRAAELLQAGLGISRDLGDELGQAKTLRLLAMLQCKTGDFRAAADGLQAALDIARELGSRMEEGNGLKELGVVRQLTGDLRGAAEALEAALDIARDLGGLHDQADALTSLGTVRRLTGDYRRADQALQAAQRLCLRNGDRRMHAEALNETGTLRRVQGDIRRAEACHSQALQLARDIASAWDEAEALAGLGRCAQAAGRTADARDHLRQALQIFQRMGGAEATQVSTELDALTQPRPHADPHDRGRLPLCGPVISEATLHRSGPGHRLAVTCPHTEQTCHARRCTGRQIIRYVPVKVQRTHIP
jgi:class 3 adenylate cyclase/tetratricopeptide (TPR) repeat protein